MSEKVKAAYVTISFEDGSDSDDDGALEFFAYDADDAIIEFRNNVRTPDKHERLLLARVLDWSKGSGTFKKCSEIPHAELRGLAQTLGLPE